MLLLHWYNSNFSIWDWKWGYKNNYWKRGSEFLHSMWESNHPIRFSTSLVIGERQLNITDMLFFSNHTDKDASLPSSSWRLISSKFFHTVWVWRKACKRRSPVLTRGTKREANRELTGEIDRNLLSITERPETPFPQERLRPGLRLSYLPVALEGEGVVSLGRSRTASIAFRVAGGRQTTAARGGASMRLIIWIGVIERPLLHLRFASQLHLQSFGHALSHLSLPPALPPSNGEPSRTNSPARDNNSNAL